MSTFRVELNSLSLIRLSNLEEEKQTSTLKHILKAVRKLDLSINRTLKYIYKVRMFCEEYMTFSWNSISTHDGTLKQRYNLKKNFFLEDCHN